VQELVFELNVGPVSQQARGPVKEVFKSQLRALTAVKDFLFSGDVKVDVEWGIHEQVRYETDRSADVDNILKPLLDALAGPDGIIVDDNQVQAVSCHWVDTYQLGTEHVRIRVDDPIGVILPKAGLRFVQLDGGLCVPISGTWPAALAIKLLDIYASALKHRNDALAAGMDYYQTQFIMPVQRIFHRSRLGEFDVVAEGAIRAELTARM